MALLTILRYPDPRLHTVAQPVAAVDERIRRLVDDLLQTMYSADGVGRNTNESSRSRNVNDPLPGSICLKR